MNHLIITLRRIAGLTGKTTFASLELLLNTGRAERETVRGEPVEPHDVLRQAQDERGMLIEQHSILVENTEVLAP